MSSWERPRRPLKSLKSVVLSSKERGIMSINQQVFAFRIGTDLFCLPIDFVRKVLTIGGATAIQVKNKTVRHDNAVIPLVDLARYESGYSTPDLTESKHVIVMENGMEAAGLCVDECCGVFAAFDRVADQEGDGSIQNDSRTMVTAGQLQLKLVDVKLILKRRLKDDSFPLSPHHTLFSGAQMDSTS
jgi:chemotaxis signal transduction protein